MSFAWKSQVLLYRKRGIDDSILGRVADALFSAIMRREDIELILVEQYASALQLYEAHNRSEQRCLSRAISADDRYHRACPQFDAYVSQHGRTGEVHEDILKGQHQWAPNT